MERVQRLFKYVLKRNQRKMTEEQIKIPKDVCAKAKVYIKEVIDTLREKGQLQQIDSAAIYMLAQDYNTFIKAQEILRNEGLTVRSDRGNIAPHPLIKIAKDAQTQAVRLMQEFGLTTKARTKITKKDIEDDEESPLDVFIKQSKELR